MANDGVQHVDVEILVAVHGDVAEADHALEGRRPTVVPRSQRRPASRRRRGCSAARRGHGRARRASRGRWRFRTPAAGSAPGRPAGAGRPPAPARRRRTPRARAPRSARSWRPCSAPRHRPWTRPRSRMSWRMPALLVEPNVVAQREVEELLDRSAAIGVRSTSPWRVISCRKTVLAVRRSIRWTSRPSARSSASRASATSAGASGAAGEERHVDVARRCRVAACVRAEEQGQLQPGDRGPQPIHDVLPSSPSSVMRAW
jgi:hypothetical protein